MVLATRDTETILYPYAFSEEGKLVYVHDVGAGKFTCLNPECKGEMIARQGDVRTWHFAHKVSSVACSAETALHFTAKMVLDKTFHEGGFPAIYYPCQTCGREQLLSMADCDRLDIEATINGVRPDVAFFVGDRIKFVLEVVVSHDISQKTLRVYRDTDTPVVVWMPTMDDLQGRLAAVHATRTHYLGSSRCAVCVKHTQIVNAVIDAGRDHPTSVLDFQLCDYSRPPTPGWGNCQPCPLCIGGHCDSSAARLYRSWKTSRGTE